MLAQQGALLRRNLRKPSSIESRRIAVERMITLEFPHRGAFFAEYSSNLSMTGMFIRTDRIQRPGTVAAFEFNLADGSGLITGEAEVVWVRRRHQGPDRPAGLGMRFTRLDKEGRELIRRAVEKRLGDTGGEIGEARAQSTRPDGDVTEARPDAGARQGAETDAVPLRAEDEVAARLRSYAGAGVAQTQSGRWRWGIFGALAGLLAGALLFLYQGVGAAGAPEAEPGAVETAAGGAEAPREMHTPTGGARGNGTAAQGSREIGGSEERPAVPPTVSPESERKSREIVDAVMAWAEAWSMQRVDAYLTFYAESYRPPGDMSLAEWSALRRDRISGPRRIEVGITDLEVELLGADRARARFQQAYVSDRYRDRTRKILELVRERGRWKIQEERAEGAPRTKPPA